jgi:hypothetical protein
MAFQINGSNIIDNSRNLTAGTVEEANSWRHWTTGTYNSSGVYTRGGPGASSWQAGTVDLRGVNVYPTNSDFTDAIYRFKITAANGNPGTFNSFVLYQVGTGMAWNSILVNNSTQIRVGSCFYLMIKTAKQSISGTQYAAPHSFITAMVDSNVNVFDILGRMDITEVDNVYSTSNGAVSIEWQTCGTSIMTMEHQVWWR